MLYRAFVYPLDRDTPQEVVVFFECSPPDRAYQKLPVLVAAAWSCRPIDVKYHGLDSEEELRRDAEAPPPQVEADADVALLETGFGPDGADYPRPAHTQLLCGPRWHARLLAAQQRVGGGSLKAAASTPPRCLKARIASRQGAR